MNPLRVVDIVRFISTFAAGFQLFALELEAKFAQSRANLELERQRQSKQDLSHY